MINWNERLKIKSEIKNLHIHLYFIATEYLWYYAFVENIDN